MTRTRLTGELKFTELPVGMEFFTFYYGNNIPVHCVKLNNTQYAWVNRRIVMENNSPYFCVSADIGSYLPWPQGVEAPDWMDSQS